MSKTKKNTCTPPTLKELPAEFTKQISISSDDGDILGNVLRAALPQLAKKAAAESYGYSTAVKSINFASNLHESTKDIVDGFNSYHGGLIQELTGELGINFTWRHEGPCGTTSSDVRDLYDGTFIDVHVVIGRKLKDKKELARHGVK